MSFPKSAFLLLLLIQLAHAGFVINTTAGFDAGLKSNSSGNYEIETYTDNLNISSNSFALGNMYSDRFTFPDADASTWKWTDYQFNYSMSGTGIMNISNGLFNSEIVLNEDAIYFDNNLVLNNMLTGDFDVQVNYSNFNPDGAAGIYDGLDFSDATDWMGTFAFGSYRYYDGASSPAHAYAAIDWATTFTMVETADTSGILRVVRVGDLMTYYFWNSTASAWEQIDSTTYVAGTGDAYPFLYTTASSTASFPFNPAISYGEFKINSGTLTTAAHRTSGNWTSATQTMTGDYLKNTTITHSGLNATNYITQVEWLVAGVSVANYTTDITTGASTTITAPTAGSFASVNAAFKVRLYLVGGGLGSPVISSITGEYFSNPNNDAVIITDNSVKMLWLLNKNATLSGITSDVGHTVLFNQSGFYTYLLPTTANTWYGQSINETANYDMSGVVITLAESTARYIRYANLTFTVRIETDNANKPSGTLANANATATLNSTQILSNTYSAQYYQAATPFIFNSSFTLTANTIYWIVLKPSGGSGYEYFATGYDRTDRYPRGNLSTTTTSGVVWTMGINDLWFHVLTPNKNASAISYNAGTSTATLAAGWFIEVDGTGELVMGAGETLTGEVVAAGKYIQVGAFGGGMLTMIGTSTNYSNIFTPNNATTRKDYPVMVYYMGRMRADYANITGYASGASLFINAVYGGFQIRNSFIKNLYANSAGYPVMLTTGLYSTMNNCTIIKSHASYPIYMTAYAGQGIVLINNNITTTSAYALAIYNTATITYAGLSVVDNTFNGVPLNMSHITHVYSTGSTYIGHVVSPRILNNGTPVANASVSLRTQFGRNDLPNQLYGYGFTDRTVSWYPTANIGASSAYDYGTIATTDANGYPKDELGLNTLWMVDTAYIGTAKTLYTYFGGSNTSIRPAGYTWANNGSDYGYIITATDGNNSKSVVVNPSATYTTDISIYSEPITPVPTPTYIFLRSPAQPTKSSDSGGAVLLAFAFLGIGVIGVKSIRGGS